MLLLSAWGYQRPPFIAACGVEQHHQRGKKKKKNLHEKSIDQLITFPNLCVSPIRQRQTQRKMSSFTIRTPCSSANIGPGFDVIGLALTLYLEVRVTIDSSTATSSQHPLNCRITYEDASGSTEQISLDPEVNLITRVALYVLRCNNQRAFPGETHVHIRNPIPLGRGLGSSGTAVVAGVTLGNEVGKLGLSKERLLDYCLMIGTTSHFLYKRRRKTTTTTMANSS